MSLPAHLVERRERVRDACEMLRSGPQHTVGVTVSRLRGCSAQLHWCSQAIEAAVTSLGVDTTYDLLTRLRDVAGELQRVDAAWTAFATGERERARQYEELYEALSSHCATLRSKHDAAERELRQLVAQRDAQDATLDMAVEYLHSVVAEHAAWQERHGYNAQQLPVEEQRYADKCVAAMRALYTVRQLQQQQQQQQQEQQRQSVGMSHAPLPRTSIATTAAVTAQAPPPPPPLLLTPVNTCTVSLVDDAATLTARWCSAASARQCVAVPSTRLRYTPPAQEVALLRRVLAMGTGSAALMADIDDKQTRYKATMARIHGALARLRASLQRTRDELHAMRQYMLHLHASSMPFAASQDELLRVLRQHVAQRLREQQQQQTRLSLAAAAASAPTHMRAAAGGSAVSSSSTTHWYSSHHNQHHQQQHLQSTRRQSHTSRHDDNGDDGSGDASARHTVAHMTDASAAMERRCSVSSLMHGAPRASLELSGPTTGYLFPLESSTHYSFSVHLSASANNDTSSFM